MAARQPEVVADGAHHRHPRRLEAHTVAHAQLRARDAPHKSVLHHPRG
eukprot:CAMPEP_0170150684 /NCGR_PEP_ID=MMETSP0033_2-20121228/47272_1 /TAXON_ID=195969 /ORGANISM="Dolichomastix tenuilepis, Strain CCMP3274" /LENGTH=47 /DNA_ID= /DNA_START= /DNA_END= /DNA_ORIENTATION=